MQTTPNDLSEPIREAGPRLPKLPLAVTLRLRFGLTKHEGRAFAALLERGHISREAMHAAMTQNGAPATNRKNLDVLIYKLRRKLARFDLTIETLWGEGFTLDKANRDRVRELITEYDAGIAAAATPTKESIAP